jgi:hypothetical protein
MPGGPFSLRWLDSSRPFVAPFLTRPFLLCLINLTSSPYFPVRFAIFSFSLIFFCVSSEKMRDQNFLIPIPFTRQSILIFPRPPIIAIAPSSPLRDCMLSFLCREKR